MAEPINLNKARKDRAKADRKTKAAENRARFGQPKGANMASKLEGERARRVLDGKKREP